MKKLFLTGILLCISFISFCQTYSTGNGEYFVDTDPGVGNGTLISSTIMDSVNASISVNTSGLSAGFHRVYIRYEDSLGHWSNTMSYLFSVENTSSSGAALVVPLVIGEYFLDTDPGPGNGKLISSFSSADSTNQSIAVNTAGLTPGFHRVYLRYKDSLGFWGETMSYLFSTTPTSTSGAGLVVKINVGEYFLDTDPGVGNGTPLSSFTMADSVDQTISISTAGLTAGFHRVYLRYKDSLGFWGNTNSYLFSAINASSSGGALVVPISTGEYFVDTDPGPGNGIAISSFSGADSLNQSVSINTLGLSVGFHRAFVRYRDSLGNWGAPSNYLFTVTAPISAAPEPPIVAGEYFMDEADPGPGNATPLSSFASADSINQTLSINTSSMTNGNHSLFIRFMDSAGKWGLASAVPFSICSNSPGLINGITALCMSSTTTLSDTSAGGTWSSNNTLVATIGTGGLLTAVGAGSAIITYAVTTACGNVFQVAVVTVQSLNALSAISGISSVCVGATTSLVDLGGTWSSGNNSIATVGTNGVVTGENGGTVVISYSATNICGTTVETDIVTVNPFPAIPPSITGTTSVCTGNMTALTDATTGGVWSSSNTSVATVGSAGVVSGLTIGSSTITYTVTNGCGSNMITAAVTVLSIPVVQVITGADVVCTAATITLYDITGSGNWSSTNTSTATINGGGMVTGVSTGSATISYTVTNICGSTSNTYFVTVNPLPIAPASITGMLLVCSGGGTTSLSDTSGGGAWSSSDNGVASVGSTGYVTAGGTGIATISYTETNSCGNVSATTVVTVDGLPNAGSISGTALICIGSTTNLTDAATDGSVAWSSGNTSVATVGGTGNVMGTGGGSVVITYSVTNNCGTTVATFVVTVDTVLTTAGIITGADAVCPGANIYLTDALTGGSWSASNANAVVTDLGLVHGLIAGFDTISYILSNVCGSIASGVVITINPNPVVGTITGIGTICVESPVAFSDTATGGSWSSSNTGIASVGSNTGVVTGIFPGITTIIYAVTNSCGTANIFKDVVVNPYAGIISGPTSVTAGSSVGMSETVSGGTWSIGNSEVAIINGSTGVVTGVTLGTTTISYTITTGCGTATDTMAFAVGYCIPDHDSAAASLTHGWIVGKFVFAGLVDSLIDFSRPNGTNNYEDLTATYTAYASVNSTVICGIRDSLGLGSAQVYIDFNNDEIFEPSESVGGMSTVNNVITAFNVTIPTYADTGMHRMRVIFSYGGGVYGGGTYPDLSPCAVSEYGDVRDYSVYIQNYPFFTNTSPSTRACQNTETPIDTLLSVFNQAAGDAEQWTVLSYPYHGTLSGFPETRTTTGSSVTPTGLSYTGAYEYNGDDEFTIRVYDGTRYADVSVHVVDGISSITGSLVIDTSSSLTLFDSTSGGTWSSNNTVIATINSSTGVAMGGRINGVAIITYSLTDSVCGSIFTTTELPVVEEACYPTFINATASKTDGISLQGLYIPGELGTYLYDNVPCNGTDNYENLDSTYSITLNKNTNYKVNFPGSESESIQVWIDYNHDGVFADSEIIGGGTWPYYPYEDSIRIGKRVLAGIYRMRVVANAPGYPIYDTTGRYYPNINPCAYTVQYGDGRDYNVIVDSLDHAPHFAKLFRTPDLNNICENTGAINLDSMLAITDVDSGQTETWTIINPGHGIFGGFNNTQISNGYLIIDSGLTYTPDTGFSGYDNFVVQVSDGFLTDVITIGVHVGLPDPGTIGAYGTCNGNGNEVYIGYSCLALGDYIGNHLRGFDQSYSYPPGIWTSSNTAVATIDSFNGVVTGVSLGETIITYTVTDSCGTSYTTYPVFVIPVPIVPPCNCPPPPPPPPPPPGCISAYFINGFYQNFTTCIGEPKNIDSLLTINDANTIPVTETWYIGSAPSHGTLGGFSESIGTDGGLITPTGLTYTPDSGFTGHDAFAVYITNGICTPYWTYISVLVGPYAGIISGDSVVALGSYDTLLYDAEPDGIWTSSNAGVTDVSIFSIGDYGILDFIAPGNTVITYTVDNYCGEASTTFPLRVDNDNLYITGRYIQLGIAPNGTFGSTLDAPASFYANAPDIAYWDPEACYSDTSFRKLGIVYDYGHDGWTTGSPAYYGDYVVHGVPQEGWSVALDGVTSEAFNYNYQYLCSGFTGWFNTSDSRNAGVVNSNGTTIATWQGHIDSANRHFAITQTTQLDTNASWVVMTTKLVNTGVTVNNVFFNRTISPKNDLGEAGSLITTNKISSALSPGEVMVSANGTAHTNSYVALAAQDSRAKVYIIDSGILTMDSLAKIWNGTSNYLLSGRDTAAAAIGLVYNLGTINAGDSVTVTYAYIFSDSTGIDSVFANPELSVSGILYPVTDTVTNCNIHHESLGGSGPHIIYPSIVNGQDYTWQWAPANGLYADTGVVDSINLTLVSGTLVYTITGTSKNIGDTVQKIFTIVVNTDLPDNSITGNLVTCTGSLDSAFTDTVTGGMWSSSNYSVVAINIDRSVLLGISAGTATISYIVSNTCATDTTTAVVTVNPSPDAGSILGPSSVCVGATISLSDTGANGIGSWVQGDFYASIDSDGVVSGITHGVGIISYIVTNSCGTAHTNVGIEVLALANAGTITGNNTMCIGGTMTLSEDVGGGVWSSSGDAAVDGSGNVTAGESAGTAIISYTATNGCGSRSATIVVTVSTVPEAGAITGAGMVCAGATTTLSDTASGGVWSSDNTSVAIVGGSGIVTGEAGGTAVISYVVSNGCNTVNVSTVVTVNPLPNTGSIIGNRAICVSTVTSLSDAASGGVWSSTGDASIDGSGNVTGGISAGTATISYTVTNGCGSLSATAIVTVSTAPGTGTITGTMNVCASSAIQLTDLAGSGVWSSSNTAAATIDGTGVVYGIAAGTTTISYVVSNGCGSATATSVIIVLPQPARHTGIGGGAYCAGGSGVDVGLDGSDLGISYQLYNGGTMIDGSLPGTGYPLDFGLQTLGGSYGIVSTDTTTGCTNGNYGGAVITVDPLPNAGEISESSTICQGASTYLNDYDASNEGVWSSGLPGIASVGTNGMMIGVSGGTATISYTVNNSCGTAYTTIVITINPSVATGSILGIATVCQGVTTSLSDTTTGGVWISDNTSFATVGSATGIVTGGLNYGQVTISYTLNNGCGIATTEVTVNAAPDPGSIYQPNPICQGSTLVLNTFDGGFETGVWSSAITNIATVGSSGLVYGVSAGTSTISYTINNSCGTAYAITVVTVDPSPGSIFGIAMVCQGATTILTDVTLGGVWTSDFSGTATIGSTTGIVTGVNSGEITINYSLNNGCGTAYVQVTVDAAPNAGNISTSSPVCQGASTNLDTYDGTYGGVWSSASAGIATVGTNGMVNGISAGTTTITYTITNSCGTAYTTTVVSINPSVGEYSISGATTICQGTSTSLTDSTLGGVWTSESSGIGSVGSTTGIVTGISSGFVNLYYTLNNGCGTAYIVVTVDASPNPGSISSTSSVCQGATTYLNIFDGSSGGTWSSGSTAIATVGTSGMVTGQSAGTAIVTYTITNACGTAYATTVVTVNPSAGNINGITTVCQGATTDLTDNVPGGVWISDNTSFANVGSSSGMVTGVNYGNVTITYTLNNGCSYATTVVTVYAAPNAGYLSGNASICQGTTTPLNDYDAIGSGVWSSGSTGIATVGSTGLVAGIGSGTATISYTINNSCGTNSAMDIISVNSLPSVYFVSSSNPTVCGATNGSLLIGGLQPDTLSWVIYNYSDESGFGTGDKITVTANSLGEYALPNLMGGEVISNVYIESPFGCYSTDTLTGPYTFSNPAVSPINGANSVCVGSVISLTDVTSDGTWSSFSTDVDVNGSGDVTGSSVGTASITYFIGSGCFAATVITINPAPNAGAISGASSVNIDSNITLTESVSGGIWTTSNTNAVVSAGIVTGEAAGTVTISYGVTNGCGTVYATKVITINNPSLPGINGNTSVCQGTTSQLTDATTGGVWSLSSSYATIVGSTGVVTASSSGAHGIATVTYTVGSAVATIVITVNPNPSAVQGPGTACAGATVMLTDLTAGGSWSSSGAASISGIGTSTTFVGTAAGVVNITYMITATGCISEAFTTTIIATPAPIAGVFNVCTSVTTELSDANTGGGWTSSNTAIASVSGAYITGQSAGTAIITYVLSGCSTTQVVTVNTHPGVITGNAGSVCPGSSFTLADGTGTWSSGNTAVATVGSGGMVMGVSGGTSVITYALTGITGCTATTTVTINAAPAIAGVTSICANASTTLSDASTGGTWSSGNTLIATIGSSTGIVSGVGKGIVNIVYTTAAHCTIPTTLTVNAAPAAIGGPTNKVCVGNTITLSDNAGGGAWSSSNTTAGTVDGSGDITGRTGGTTIITYTLAGCYVSAAVTVNNLPGAINGASEVCSGATTTLTDATAGGAWSITGSTATIGATGIVTGGSSAGTAIVSYTLASTGCGVGDILTISPIAGPITGGGSAICAGSMTGLSDGGSGTWSSSSTAVAQVGSATGILTGEAAGTATISYLSGGCYAKTVVTVSGAVGVIRGSTSVCQGLPISLSDATTGGTWSSSNTLVATVGTGSGLVTTLITGATSAATANISYSSAAGCTASVTITVNPIPLPIQGVSMLCQGKSATLTDGSEPGGTWSLIGSSATIVGSSGVITASSSGANGANTISYTMGGCYVTTIVTVYPNPSAVQGATTACAGVTVSLTDLTVGGTWSSTGAASISGAGTTTTFVGSTAGTVSITYMIAATGCISQSFTTTIVANPAPIAGVFNLCTGVTTQLSDPSAGGGWTSGNTVVATVSGAYVTGHTAGTALLTYVLSGCSVTQAVTMTQTPAVGVIGAPATISLAGGAVTISDTTAGGIWTSSSTVIALIGSTETTTTIKAMATVTTSSSVISYTVTNGICATTVTKTIGAATAVRPGGGTGTGGTTVVYVGTAATLPADELSGGLWSSSDNSIATVDGNGVVTGMMPGIAMITHEVTGDDGTVTANVTDVVVTAVPASISLVPNPNKGTFVVKDTVGSVGEEEVTLEVTDVLGRVLYSSKVTAQGGRLNETIMLSNTLANGIYMLNVKSSTENKSFHFVIEQ